MSWQLSMSRGLGGLEMWAERKKNLGNEVGALTTHIQYAQAILYMASSNEIEIQNPWLEYLMQRLQQKVDDAYVVLNELNYFRVQDELHRTSRAVDVHPKGFIDRLHFHARQAARVATAILKPSSSSHDNAKFIEKLASVDMISSTCCVGNGAQVQDVKAPKPKFNRVVLSKKMTEILEKLKDLSAKVIDILMARPIRLADLQDS